MLAPRAEAATGRVIAGVARWLAYGGGVILASVSLMVVISVIGRRLDGIWVFGPITGDYELVEAGCAIAVFAFLPWCQINRGHVAVDIVVQALPARIKALSGLIGDILLAVAAFIIARQLWLAFGERFPHGSDRLRAVLDMGPRPFFPQTSYELEIPTWIPYGLCVIGAGLFLVTALYTVWRSLNWTLRGAEAEI
jgi:TRAP-type C4-dicarboxylate transport system permease small subunit